MTSCPLVRLDHRVGDTGSFTRMYMSTERSHNGDSHRDIRRMEGGERASEGQTVKSLNW